MLDAAPDDVIGRQLAAGDHVCAFYRTPAERDLLLVPFLAAGLQAGSRCTCVVDSTPPSAVLEQLSAYVDVERHVDAGRLEVLDSDETYFARGGFLPRRCCASGSRRRGPAATASSGTSET